MRKIVTLSILTAGLAGAALLAGCGEDTSTNAVASEQAAPAAPSLPAELFSTEPLVDIQSLVAIKESAGAGDTVAFNAVIAGRVEPFTDGRAVMMVADKALELCTDDHCPTPWDACCAMPEAITENSATVQVVDAEGSPLKLGLKGQNNLEPGAEVQVQGTVSQAGEGYFIVNANRIYVTP